MNNTHTTYGKETLFSMASALLQWIRQQSQPAWVLSHVIPENANGNADWETLLAPLASAPLVQWCHLSSQSPPLSSSFILMGSVQGLAGVVWQADARRALSTYSGGWTVSAGETWAMVDWVLPQCREGIVPENLLALITQQKVLKTEAPADPRLEGLLKSLIQGLEHQNNALISVNEDLKRLNKQVVDHERLAAIGQLCSVVAHEIRNPLGLIDLYAKLVEGQLNKVIADTGAGEHPAMPTVLSNLAMVSEAVQGLEVILGELTQYSRPVELELVSTPVVPLVQHVCQFYQPKYDEKGVTLTVHASEGMEHTVFAKLDAARIRQALINLLKNALEASAKGTTVSVTIASRQNDHDVYIKVADEGSGISEGAQAKLFTPYFSTKGNGTGLGLAHSQKILQAHGGRVALLSSATAAEAELIGTKRNAGSTFALILPRDYGSPLERTEKAAPPEGTSFNETN